MGRGALEDFAQQLGRAGFEADVAQQVGLHGDDVGVVGAAAEFENPAQIRIEVNRPKRLF